MGLNWWKNPRERGQQEEEEGFGGRRLDGRKSACVYM